MKTLKKSLPNILSLTAFIGIIFFTQLNSSVFAEKKSKEIKDKKSSTAIIGEALELNPSRSSIRWYGTNGSPVIAEHSGGIKVKKGKVMLNTAGEITAAELIMDMSSITNDNLSGELQSKIVQHLKSPDFFDVKKYPEATFKSTQVQKISDKKYQLIGQLTIKNTKKNTNITGFYTTDGFNYSFKGNFIFDRTDFDVKYGSGKFFSNLGDKLINDTVKLSFDLRANPI
ncbi:MAG: YceI family protein [Candidatus Melainabacteria bacterium]|nr:YceI family protein [Candidatus Melainabacteria bacterium]